MSATPQGNGVINPMKTQTEDAIQSLKEELPGYAVEIAVEEDDDLDAIFQACEVLEDEIPIDENLLIYENFNTDTEGYPRTIVEIEFFTDRSIEETNLDDVHEVGY